jgi:hypothetical protein
MPKGIPRAKVDYWCKISVPHRNPAVIRLDTSTTDIGAAVDELIRSAAPLNTPKTQRRKWNLPPGAGATIEIVRLLPEG